MNSKSSTHWKATLPLTMGEREGRKMAAIVRASVRIAPFRESEGGLECLFVSHPIKGFEVPGGAVDPDEDPLHSALRELSEEAGLTLDPSVVKVELAGFVPIIDQQNGHWLDIVYVAILPRPVQPSPGAEFATTWIPVSELGSHLSSNAKQIVACALNYIDSGEK